MQRGLSNHMVLRLRYLMVSMQDEIRSFLLDLLVTRSQILLAGVAEGIISKQA